MPRDTLNRDQIVKAAIDLLDAEGLDGLNMRALGKRLGSAATAVYWHVGSKENLIALAGDQAWNEIALPDLATTDWRTAATQMATELHAMLTRHPWLVQAFGSYMVFGPGKARHDDHSLAVFEAAGFTEAQADQAAASRLHLRARQRPRPGRGRLVREEAQPRRRQRRGTDARQHGKGAARSRRSTRACGRAWKPPPPSTPRHPPRRSSSASRPSSTASKPGSPPARRHDQGLADESAVVVDQRCVAVG